MADISVLAATVRRDSENMATAEIDEQLRRLTFPAGEINRLIEPYVSERQSADTPSARALLRQRQRGILHLILDRYIRQLKGLRRNQLTGDVNDHYESIYSGATGETFGYFPAGRDVTYSFAGEVLRMKKAGAMLAGAAVLEKAIRIIGPRTVCEGGSGQGANIIYLASRNPDISFSGFDVSQSAVDNATARLAKARLDLRLPGGAPISPDLQARMREQVRFFQSSFAAIDLPDKSVDVLFTHHALEQIWEIREATLREIRRVTKDYVLFFEPFSDANDAAARVYLHACNYFRARVSSLADHGFEVLNYYDDFMLKPTFRYSLVIAKVR
jgi:SAM-dependent methyltransferase